MSTLPVAASKAMTAPRISIGVGATRGLSSVRLTTPSARAMTSAVFFSSPYSKSKQMLPGMLSWIVAAPGAIARAGSTRTGRSSYSMSTRSAASRAARGVSAMTSATSSPTKRTRSRARIGRSGTKILCPPRPGGGWIGRNGGKGLARQVLAGEHQQHAGAARGGNCVDCDDARMRAIGAAKAGMRLAVQIPVVGEAALAGQQPLILTPPAVFVFGVRHSGSHAQEAGQRK